MSKIRVVMYVHSNKESNFDLFSELEMEEGIKFSPEAKKKLMYALYEVTVPIMVDTETGLYEIIKDEVEG